MVPVVLVTAQAHPLNQLHMVLKLVLALASVLLATALALVLLAMKLHMPLAD